MNILFIYPSKLDRNGRPVKYKKAFLPPLSLAILNSLTPAEHKVKVINDIVEDVDFSDSYDLVGITAMTSQAERAYQIADHFRESGTKVVIGGIHASILPEEAKQHADSVVIGEAENIWEQVLADAAGGRLKEFYQDSIFPDLKKLVIPKWDNINLGLYPRPIGYKLPKMPIFTTRGCPFGCKFCSVTKYYGKSYRVKPISHVIKEIESVNAESFFFVDDNIVCNPDYSRELFKALARKNIRWFSQISTTVLKHPDLIDLMGKAGSSGLLIGIESIDSKNLRSVGKDFNKSEQYEELFSRLKNAGVRRFPSIIFGLDNDDRDVFRRTLNFLIKTKVSEAVFCILTPLPGTALFDKMNKEERILHNNWSMYDLNNVVFRPKNLSGKELQKAYWEAYQEFYSLKNIATRVLDRMTMSRDVLRATLSGLFYGFYFRRMVYSFEHPFSGGVGRIKN
jgi:radical SAM superfamily enzyme YgiQ (UPF0313 family)